MRVRRDSRSQGDVRIRQFHDDLKGRVEQEAIRRLRRTTSRVDELFQAVAAKEGYQLTVDLEAQTITAPDGKSISFEVEEFRKHCLLNGLDDIGLTLQHVDDIRAYEAKRSAEAPWLF